MKRAIQASFWTFACVWPSALYLQAAYSADVRPPLAFGVAMGVLAFFRLAICGLAMPWIAWQISVRSSFSIFRVGLPASLLAILSFSFWSVSWNLQLAIPRSLIKSEPDFEILVTGLVFASKIETFAIYYATASALLAWLVLARKEFGKSVFTNIQYLGAALLAILALLMAALNFNASTALLTT